MLKILHPTNTSISEGHLNTREAWPKIHKLIAMITMRQLIREVRMINGLVREPLIRKVSQVSDLRKTQKRKWSERKENIRIRR